MPMSTILLLENTTAPTVAADTAIYGVVPKDNLATAPVFVLTQVPIQRRKVSGNGSIFLFKNVVSRL